MMPRISTPTRPAAFGTSEAAITIKTKLKMPMATQIQKTLLAEVVYVPGIFDGGPEETFEPAFTLFL